MKTNILLTKNGPRPGYSNQTVTFIKQPGHNVRHIIKKKQSSKFVQKFAKTEATYNLKIIAVCSIIYNIILLDFNF
jgi:hypothetical protein